MRGETEIDDFFAVRGGFPDKRVDEIPVIFNMVNLPDTIIALADSAQNIVQRLVSGTELNIHIFTPEIAFNERYY